MPYNPMNDEVCVLKKLVSVYYKLQTYIIVWCFTIMIAVTFFQVVNRTVIKLNLSWPEEVARYMIVWMAFIASIVAFRKGAMISIDLLSSRLNRLFRFIFLIFSNVVIIVFAVVVAYYGFIIISSQLELGQLSPALSITMAVPYSAVPVWGVFTSIEMCASTRKAIMDFIKSAPKT